MVSTVIRCAAPAYRGATLAVHSTLGYGGGFVGPLMMGWILDIAGGQSVLARGLASVHVAVVMLVGPYVMMVWRPKALAGDRTSVSGKA